jgi:hypothetical protein
MGQHPQSSSLWGPSGAYLGPDPGGPVSGDAAEDATRVASGKSKAE